MGTSSSFYNVQNPTPANTPALYDALVAATTASNQQLAAYTVYQDTWASSVTIDWALANCHRLTLSGPTTALTFSHGVDGEKLVLELTQDATGGRLITLPASIRYSQFIPSVVLSTNAGWMDKLGFMYNSAAGKYDLVAIINGFN